MNLINSLIRKLSAIKTWFWKTSLRNKVLIIAVVAALLWFGGHKIIARSGQQPQYQTAQAEKGTLITSISASGTVSQGSSVSITTNATGIVKEVYVKDGDTVSKGDKIADIILDADSQQKQAAGWSSYLSAKNSVEAAKAEAYTLRSKKDTAWKTFYDLSTSSTYQNADGSPREDIRNSSAEFQSAQADWLAAEAKYKNQQGVISQQQSSLNSAWFSYVQLSSTITASMAGKVSGLTLSPGSSITSSVGKITAEEGTLQASVNLTEIDVVKVKLGQKVTLTLDAFPDKTFTGRVATVNTNGTVSSGVTTYPTTIVFDSALDNIYPNMAVNATIITDIKDHVVLVPSAAVQTANGESSVRVMKNGQVTPVLVEVGGSNDTQTEITSGLSQGDVVITGSVSSTNRTGSQGTTSPFGGFGGRGGAGRGGGFQMSH